MRPKTVTLTNTGYSNWIPLDQGQNGFNVGVQIQPSNGANVIWSVQITSDDPFTTLIPKPVAASAPLDTGTDFVIGNIETPCRAIRLAATVVSGSVSMTIIQGRG